VAVWCRVQGGVWELVVGVVWNPATPEKCVVVVRCRKRRCGGKSAVGMVVQVQEGVEGRCREEHRGGGVAPSPSINALWW